VKSRVLPILNAVGCLVLAGLVVVQWNKELALDRKSARLGTELAAAKEQAAAEAKRAAGLERDISVLKESIESSQQASEEVARKFAEKVTQCAGLEAEMIIAREQVKTWQDAIATRDAKLRDLDAELTATRRRLDEAVTKLKAAGAR
jgi:chromosome segregation ATPase